MLNENMVELNKNYFLDCREVLKTIPDKSINLFFEDMPYNTTGLGFEYEVDLEEYWRLRLPKLADNGLFLLTSVQPFTSKIIISNLQLFSIEWIWEKTMGTNFLNLDKHPFKKHESVIVFGKKYTYNPQKEEGKRFIRKAGINEVRGKGAVINSSQKKKTVINEGDRYPSSIQLFPNSNHNSLHPTQKPLELIEYFIRTYTNENDIVFDGYSGSGTTAIACIRNNRQYIICENKKEYFDIQTKRILEEIDKTSLFNSLGGRQLQLSA